MPATAAGGVIAPAPSRKTRPEFDLTLLQNPHAESILRDFRWPY